MKVLGWLGVAVAILLLAAAGIVGVTLVHRADLFAWDKPLAATDLKTFVSFTTALVGSAATVLGFVFLLAYNRRTQTIAERTEQRENVEAAAVFIGLISTPDGKYAAPGQVAGAVWSLLQLGPSHRQTAVGVIESALNQQALDASSATQLLNHIFGTGSKDEIALAATMLTSISPKLASDSDFDWPLHLYDHWPSDWDLEPKAELLVAITNLLLSHDVDWWIPNRIAWAALLFYDATQSLGSGDPLHNSAACLLQVIVEAVDVVYPGPDRLEELAVSQERRQTLENLRKAALPLGARKNRSYIGVLLTSEQQLRVKWTLETSA